MAGFLRLVQLPLETEPQPVAAHVQQVDEPTMTRALQARTTQPSLGMAPRTMHIHPTYLIGVKGWAESQILWCNVHNVRVGARMAEPTAL